jgi:hypothetical protein
MLKEIYYEGHFFVLGGNFARLPGIESVLKKTTCFFFELKYFWTKNL